ncbi:MAG: dhbF [Xanthobacteraceae bacterium]|jgi:FkbH-like protein|nr:dhbF [Xanthobacteraceae bacterium]
MDALSRNGWVELTSRQRSIWLELQSFGNAASYQIGGYTRIECPIDPDLFGRAIGVVMARNEALMLQVDPIEPRQRLERGFPTPVHFIDFSNEPDGETAFLAMAESLFATPLPLGEHPLFSVTLAKIDDDVWYSLLRCHHLIVDGLSIPILTRMVAQAYDALVAGDEEALPTGSCYFDFADEDTQYRGSARALRDIEHWKQRLVPLPQQIFAPRQVDSAAASAVARAPAVLLPWELPREDYDRFLNACSVANVRPLPAFLGLAATLAADLAQSENVVLGVAVPGRGRSARSKVGMFNGAMPAAIRVARQMDLGSLAAHVTEQLGRDYPFQRAPVDEICRALGVGREGRRGVFDIFLSYLPAELTNYDFSMAGTIVEPAILRGPEANPLAIYISENNRHRPVLIEFAFNPAYLDRPRVEMLLDRFQRLFASFCDNPATRAADLDLFADEGRRHIRGTPATEAPAIRVVSSFTAEPIEGTLGYWTRRLGLGADITFAGYNQIFQELIDPTSATRSGPAKGIAILLRVEDWLRFRCDDDPKSDAAPFLREIANSFVSALRGAASAARVPCIVVICPPSEAWDDGGAHAGLQAEIEAVLRQGTAALANVGFVDPAEVRRLYPTAAERDAESDRLGHVPYTAAGYSALATCVARRLHLMLRDPIKVIVVDCDNTLWGGVVGEDGVDGIRLEAPHLALQARLVEAANAGVLIGLCSKNIEADVLAVLRERDDMLLKPEHIVVHRINWQPKSSNLRSIAGELSLGEDSFVFLDDNPVEIAEVRANCPSIIAVGVDFSSPEGSDPQHLWPLDVAVATAEDRKRTEFYKENARRAELKRGTGDYARFIEELRLEIRSEEPREEELKRLQQLTERTNQFNINGISRPAAEFAAARGKALVRAISVADRFGDYGLVGLILAHRDGCALVTDAFLMSCRVLGRGVEHAMIAELGRHALAEGLETIRVAALNLPRNQPVRQFLAALPGAIIAPDGAVTLDTPAAQAAECRFYPEEAPAEDASLIEAAPVTLRPGALAPEIWEIIARQLNRVEAVEHAARAANTVERTSATAYRAPRTRLEAELATTLAEILGVERVGIDDNFFEIGVHSLLAVQFAARIRSQYGITLPIRALFERPRLAELIELVTEQGGTGRAYSAVVPIQTGDAGAPLFCVHPANGDAVSFMRLAKALGPGQPVYAFEALGLAPNEPMAASVEDMAGAYLDEMRRVQPKGPYYLIGWSFGGVVAYEMAHRLRQAGEEIGLLAFMDTPTPYGREEPDLTFDEVMRILAADLETIERKFELPGKRRVSNQTVTIEQVIATAQRMGVAPPEYSVSEAKRKIAVYANCVHLFRRYDPPSSDVPILLFRATRQKGLEYRWRDYTRAAISTRKVRCNHVQMGFEPFTHILAGDLLAILQGAEVKRKRWKVWTRTVANVVASGARFLRAA